MRSDEWGHLFLDRIAPSTVPPSPRHRELTETMGTDSSSCSTIVYGTGSPVSKS